MSKKKPTKKPKGFIPGASGWDQTAKSYPIKSSKDNKKGKKK
jgi:hypothetical protein